MRSGHEVDLEDVAVTAVQLSTRDGSTVCALIDVADLPVVTPWTWSLQDTGYAARFTSVKGVPKKIYMHRAILPTADGFEVDHINRNRLDNRRANLRPATRALNCWNTGKRSDNTSGYRGVSWFGQRGKWTARLTRDGRYRCLGYFDTPEEASAAYRAARAEMGRPV